MGAPENSIGTNPEQEVAMSPAALGEAATVATFQDAVPSRPSSVGKERISGWQRSLRVGVAALTVATAVCLPTMAEGGAEKTVVHCGDKNTDTKNGVPYGLANGVNTFKVDFEKDGGDPDQLLGYFKEIKVATGKNDKHGKPIKKTKIAYASSKSGPFTGGNVLSESNKHKTSIMVGNEEVKVNAHGGFQGYRLWAYC